MLKEIKPTRQDIDDINGFNELRGLDLTVEEVKAVRVRLQKSFRELLGGFERGKIRDEFQKQILANERKKP